MIVKTQYKDHEFTGVAIGADDVRRYFPRDTPFIELHMDHLEIQCGLEPGFWMGQTEISDPRLGAWLESKNFRGRPGDAPVPLALIPSGPHRYRLQALHERPRLRPAAACLPAA